MNLEEFVRDTLVQIVNGVVAAAKATAESGARVSPANVVVGTANGVAHTFVNDEYKQHANVQMIEFDVAVFASEGTGNSVDASLTVVSLLRGGGGKKSEASSGAESRIRFGVPVVLPTMEQVPPKRVPQTAQEMQARGR